MKKVEEKPSLGKPKLKDSEETSIISFKVPESLLKKIVGRCVELGFFKKNGDPAKSEYIRHTIENELSIKDDKHYDKAILEKNKYKTENISLRDELSRLHREKDRKKKK